MNRLEELAKKAYVGRAKKLGYNSAAIEKEEIERCVEKIINIFVTSNEIGVTNMVYGIHLNAGPICLWIEVVYSSEDIEKGIYYGHDYTNSGGFIPDNNLKEVFYSFPGNVKKELKQKVLDYFVLNLNEYFEIVNNDVIVLKEPTICENELK